jgi:hypothetical protein
MKIVPTTKFISSYRTGTISGYTKTEIDTILGFKSNVDDDHDKVKYSWGFTINGVECAIWDYKGSYRSRIYSTFGPNEFFEALFPPKE